MMNSAIRPATSDHAAVYLMSSGTLKEHKVLTNISLHVLRLVVAKWLNVIVHIIYPTYL